MAKIGDNVTAQLSTKDEGILLLRIDLNKDYGVSSTGKSNKVAAAFWAPLGVLDDAYEGFKINLNVSRPLPKAKPKAKAKPEPEPEIEEDETTDAADPDDVEPDVEPNPVKPAKRGMKTTVGPVARRK